MLGVCVLCLLAYDDIAYCATLWRLPGCDSLVHLGDLGPEGTTEGIRRFQGAGGG